jgi:cell division protein FtsB|tara:strand:- start:75 stop:386 length:312 start_codon:yes stop_codon:yes gene_type:complete
MSDAVSRILSRLIVLIVLGATGYQLIFGGDYHLRDLQNLKRQVAIKTAEVDSMNAELDSIRVWGDSLLNDPWVVERVARERYGFIRPGEVLVRFIETDQITPD